MSRVLFLDQYGDIGGGQTVLLSLLRAARQAGHATSVLAPGGGALEATIGREFGAAVTFIACEEPRLTHGRKGFGDLLALLGYGWRFRKHTALLRQQDIIWVNGLRYLPHMLLLSRTLPARVIYHVHIGHSALEKMLLRLAARARQTFRLVVNSRFVASGLDIAEARLQLIENALDPAFANRAFIDRFAQPGPLTAAVIGTLRPEKGQDIAAQAVPPQMALHVIGRDGDGADAWVAGLKCRAGANVRFDGGVSDVPAQLDRLNVQFNLVPSRWQEPFGLVAIEGMACSCLTIVSGTGGLAEIAERTGALIAPDSQSLGRLLADLCGRSPTALAGLARSQHARTLSHYGPERFEAQVAALLAEAARASNARH